MKTEETDRQETLRRWMNAFIIVGFLASFYIIATPWIAVWAYQSELFSRGFSSCPVWLQESLFAIIKPLFELCMVWEGYQNYVDWVGDVIIP